MPYTPVEIRHVRIKRGLLGYRRAAVDQLLDEVATSFEDVWRERADLADRAEQLESELIRQRELETLLRTTLTSAESAAEDIKEKARREAHVILGEARAEARAITRNAAGERDRLRTEIRRVRSLLAAALDAVDDADERDDRAEAA